MASDEESLYFAVWSGDVPRVKRLLADGHNPDDLGLSDPLDGDLTPLMEVVTEPEGFFGDDEAEIAELLIEAGADLGRVNAEGQTPLHLAVRAGPRAVLLLLDAGADPNTQSDVGRTPLHEAIESGSPAVAEALLTAGADPSLLDESGISPKALVEGLGNPGGDQLVIREILRRFENTAP